MANTAIGWGTRHPLTPKAIKVLALLERHGPMYGRQLLEHAPECFRTPSSGDVVDPHSPGLYSLLSRMKKRGFIEKVENYRPPDLAKFDHQTVAVAVWYRITKEGKAELANVRHFIGHQTLPQPRSKRKRKHA